VDGRAPIRWGLLSTATIAADLLPGFRRSPGNELVAVASRDDRRSRAYAETHSIPTSYPRYDDLLADDAIDAVYIPLPNALHAEWVRKALECGKHVLCEKPLTPTADEAEQLFRLAEEKGLALAEAFMYRYHPKTLRVRGLLQEGAIGELRTIRTSFTFRVADPSTDIRYSAELAGGALRDVGCYCVSFSTFAADAAPVEVHGVARMAATGVDERFYGTLVFPNGPVAQFDCALDLPLTLGVTLVGSEGEIRVPMPWYAHLEPHSIHLTRAGETVEIDGRGPNAYELEIEDLAAVIRGERPPQIPAEETLRNLRVMESLRSSAGLSQTNRQQEGERGR
jgi:D-xylose 1-dehydrogenase (NADP+, D-xylono-1,5-lactone-forming)